MRIGSHRLRVAVVATSLTILCGLAGAVAGRVYNGIELPLLVAASALSAFGIGFLLRNRPAWTAAIASGTGLAFALAAAVLITTDGSEPFGAVFADALVNAIPRTLTALIPIEPAPDTVGVPVFITWIAAGLSCELAIRYGRTLLGCLPPTLLYAAGLYLVGPNAEPAISVTVAYCLLAGAALAVTASPPSRRPDRDAEVDGQAPKRSAALAGSVIGVAVLLVAVAALAPLAGGLIATRPGDPREYVEPPQLNDIDLNPLMRIAEWAKDPERELLHVDLDGDASLRLAVLTEYDGATWQSGGDFRTAGTVLPGSGGGGFTADIEIVGLGGKLVPAVADPSAVTGKPVALNLQTRALLTPDGFATGDAYSVESDLVVVDREAAVNARPDLSDAETVAVPSNAPEVMIAIADYIRTNHDTPYERAQGLADFLGMHYAFDPDAPSGHDLPNLEFFLASVPQAGGQRGTSEHFAASYAVIARLVGLPSRVVVGFDAPAGRSTVVAGQGQAWPEVRFDGVGWVRFDPMPIDGVDPIPPEETLEEPHEEDEEEDDEGSQTDSEDYNDESLEQGDYEGEFDAEPDESESGLPVWLWPVAAAVLLAAVPVALKARRWLRRRRRFRAGPPGERVAGAWAEVVAAGSRAGAGVAEGDTAAEAAERLAAIGVDVGGLTELVNRTGFAPDAVGAAEADAAVRIAHGAIKQADRNVKRWRRILS
jgi:hypothetical protein